MGSCFARESEIERALVVSLQSVDTQFAKLGKGINDRGAIVGLIDDGAFLYDSGVFTRLDQLPEVRAAGWSAIFPTGINERGWITGYGWHADGRPASAFVMVPPPAPKVWAR